MKTWTISNGDGGAFEVYQTKAEDGQLTDAFLNGTYPTKVAAIRAVIECAEVERDTAARKLRRARAMLRRAEKADQ